AQGSLLGKLLGNLNIQISACPELSAGTLGKSASGDKVQTQSSNPACPNYVPPGGLPVENISSSSEESKWQEYSSIASSGIDTILSATSSPSAVIPIAPAQPAPLVEVLADPAPLSSSPAYKLSHFPVLLPTPTNKDLLAESMLAEPLLMTSASSLHPTKCSYLAQAPENTAVIVQGLPIAPNQPAALPAMPADPVWANPNWNQAAPPLQQPATDWSLFTAQMAPNAPAAPTMPGQFVAHATASTVTINIPDGAQGVVFETRNIGA
ncbi:hypothetical protein EV181_006379, partial [Coemansia sp. RSA 532]